MIDIERFHGRVERLEARLQAKLGLRGRNLEARLRRAGRRLPKQLHRAGQVISDAQAKVQHPKLVRLTNSDQIDHAFTQLNAHLETIDPAERRKGAVLGILGGMVFNLILLALGVAALMHWQDVI